MTVSRGDMRRALVARPADDVWRFALGWTRAVEPFWLEAIDRFAVVAAVRDERRERLKAAAETAFDRMDDWWHGRAKVIKARRNEIDSAISLLYTTASHGAVAGLIQAPTARHVAVALRTCLQLAAGSYSRDQMPTVVAGAVYTWACCRAMFPGDPAVLLQHLPADVLQAGSAPFDEHHRLFGEPATRFGLRREADAVVAEAARIWARFDDPQPWTIPDDIWTRPYDRRR